MTISQNRRKNRAKMSSFSHNWKPYIDKRDDRIKMSNAIVWILSDGGRTAGHLADRLNTPQRTIQRYLSDLQSISVVHRNNKFWHTNPQGIYLWFCYLIRQGYGTTVIEDEKISRRILQEIEIIRRAAIHDTMFS